MPTSVTRTRFTLFLASPSEDTDPAREAVVQAVQELAQESPFDDALELCLFRWDDPCKRVVLSLHNGGQRDVNEQAIHPAKVDLLIGVFCHTMGGTLAHDAIDGSGQPFGHADAATGRPWYCSEWEVAQAKDAWLFFAKRDVPEDALEDAIKVNQYRQRFDAAKRFYNRFKTESELREQTKTALRTRLKLVLTSPRDVSDDPPSESSLHPAHDALQTHLLATPLNATAPLPLVPDGLRNAALAQPTRCLRSWLLRGYAEGCADEAGRLDREFVSLTVTVPKPNAPAGSEAFKDLGEALASQPLAPAWVLVGPPGAGKTTLLHHLEMRYALAALHSLAHNLAHNPAATPPLAVRWRLSGYHPEALPEGGWRWPDPTDWLAAQWRRHHPAGPDWQRLQPQVRLLLDGANEIPAPNAQEHRRALDRWADWLRQRPPGGAPAPLMSVRQHELDLLSTALNGLRQVAVQAWERPQIQAYCLRRGQPELWRQLLDSTRLMELASNPFNLKYQCEVGAQLHRPARHRAELMSALLQVRLREAANQAALRPAGVLGATVLADLPRDWHTAPMRLPDASGLLQVLALGAVQQIRSGAGQVWPASQWRQVWQAAGQPDALLPSALHAAQTLGLLRAEPPPENRQDPTAETEPPWRWPHQLWQEFFAARALRDAVAGTADLPAGLAAPPPDAIDWDKRQQSWEPLPGPGVNAWDECVQLAVAQSKAPLAWLEHLQAEHNLALAGRAAVQDAQRLRTLDGGPAALAALQTRLRQRSEDVAVDLRQRIEAAELAHELGDERYEIHRDAQGRELWRQPRPERWISIPAGEYTLGSADENQDKRGPDGQALRLHLDAFQIAFAPVTNAEFGCFVQDKGYEDERWWPGEAKLWRQGRLDNEAARKQLTALFIQHGKAIAQDPTWHPDLRAALQQALAQGPSALKSWAAEWVLLAYPKPADPPQPFTQPAYWADARFNHPAQPVVGVCWFEAQAYCRWLAAQAGQPSGHYRLPTEAQWEAAARGLSARRWPWAGNMPPERHQINSFEAGVRRTTPVGLFINSHTPEGVADLAGNVWEWTASPYTPEGLRQQSVNQVLQPGSQPVGMQRLSGWLKLFGWLPRFRRTDLTRAPRAVRGGGWDNPASNARAGCRDGGEPDDRGINGGFRVVVCCPIEF